MLSYIVIFWMILMNMRRREQLERIVTVIVITSLPIAFYGLIQHASKDPLPWGGDVTQRVASNMGNAIFVAAYLIMAFFLTLGRLVQSFQVILTEKESRISDILRASVYLFIAALQLIAFGFADSRGPLLGWLPGMFIFGLVGLLLLRVSLHTQATRRQTQTPQIQLAPLTTNTQSQPRCVQGHWGWPSSAYLGAYAGALLRPYVSSLRRKSHDAGDRGRAAGRFPLLAAVGIRRTAARWAVGVLDFFLAPAGASACLSINFSIIPSWSRPRQSGAFGRLSTLLESEGGPARFVR